LTRKILHQPHYVQQYFRINGPRPIQSADETLAEPWGSDLAQSKDNVSGTTKIGSRGETSL
jgi:hypothetical protein